MGGVGWKFSASDIARGRRPCYEALVRTRIHNGTLQDALSLSKELSKVESLEDSKSVATAHTYESERIGVTAPLQLEARAQGNAQHREDRADQMKQVLDSALAQKKGSA